MKAPAALLAGAVAALLAGCYNRATELEELVRHHVATTGQIVVLDCSHDGRWWYDFEAGGKHRRGSSSDPAGCRQRKLGEPVTVYVNPAAPDVHRAVAPAQAYADEHGFYIPLWLWFGIGALALPLSAWMALKRGTRG